MPQTPRRWLAVAAATLITAVLLPASIAQADEAPGAISGHLLDGTTPVPNTLVQVLGPGFAFAGQATTDATGAFTITDLAPAAYTVEYSLAGGLTQYFHQKLVIEQADLVTVAAGATTQVEETVVAHGTLAGTVTHADGTPIAGVQLNIASIDRDVFMFGFGDSDGHYVIPNVPAGTYTIQFSDPSTGLREAAHQKTGSQTPDPITVAVGATTTVDEQFLPAGTISGHLTRGGQPASNVSVFAFNDNSFGFGFTDSAGGYSMQVFPGTYKVQFSSFNGLQQWAHGKLTQDAADPITVAPSEVTTVDEALFSTGTMVGHLVDADGNPVSNAFVSVTDGHSQFLGTSTDSNGDWRVDGYPGTYTVQFGTQAGPQWATGKSTQSTATAFTIVSDQTVRVDDQLAPTGTLTVSVRDTQTGQPVTDFCLNVGNVNTFPCTTTGSVTVPVLPGSYGVSADVDTTKYITVPVLNVAVTSGHDTPVVIDATPAGTITATVRDAKTGAPVPQICFDAVPVNGPSTVGGFGFCTGTTGNLTYNGLAPGSYNLLAFAQDGVHGSQWVGPHGGVGAQKKAAVITVGVGQTVSAPPITMDPKGSITGIVRDKATGAPISGATVGFTSSDPSIGGSPTEVSTDATGRYTINNLGPYDWPLIYTAAGYATEWSGNTGNRLKANPVTVKAGKTKSHDELLNRGVILTGVVTGPTGQPLPADEARIYVINSDSDDILGAVDVDATGRYTLHMLPRQNVILFAFVFLPDTEETFYYPNAKNINDAQVIRIPKRGPVDVDIATPSNN